MGSNMKTTVATALMVFGLSISQVVAAKNAPTEYIYNHSAESVAYGS